MLIAGVIVAVVLLVAVVPVRRTRFRFRPLFEAACEVAVGERRLVAYSGHRKVIGRADPLKREDMAVITASRTWIRALCEVRVDGRPLLASGGRDRIVRLWDPRTWEQVRAPERGTGPVYALCRADTEDRPLPVAGGDGPGTAVWDPFTGEPTDILGMDLAGILDAHGWVRAACQVRPSEGPPLNVTAGYDDGARIWDVAKGIGA
ncbi:WD40 repeat domain-containing protein [Streptomyces sp. NPDC059017]|uniref:WD40 repeat domain-containing protein n=1 Tax=unclassified Streptomyces TaxID=2593676 RepID=UPI0036850A32